MLITDERFFCEELDPAIPAFATIADTYRDQGPEAAEHAFAAYVRSALRADDYFKIPYYERENAWTYPGEDDYAAAERILRGELISCGYAYAFPDGKIEWASNHTENNYCEWPFQLNRHHEWRCLGRCYRETGDERYAKCFVDMLMSWCEQAICPEAAPPGATLCWRTIEAGIRLTKNWNYAIMAFYRSPYVTDHVLTTYMKSVLEHGYRLSASTSAGNWLIMEMAGLAHIAMLYPFFGKTAEWKQYAFHRLATEIDVQVYPDDFQYELTPGYHGVVVQNYTWVMETVRALGVTDTQGFDEGLKRTFRMYFKLCQPDFRTPDVNDSGRANVVNMAKLALKYYPEDEEARWFATRGKEGIAPSYTSVALPYSGMAMMRNGWGEKDVNFFMESAPFGKGHQHEDKLNVLCFAYGKNLLPDTGTYFYDTSAMRKFVLSARSHNVGFVDDLEQSRRKQYVWHPEDIKKRSDLRWNFTDDYDTAEGVYDDGFGADLLKAKQKRKIIFFKKGVSGTHPFAVVIDRFYAESESAVHDYAVQYQTEAQPYSLSENTYLGDFGDGVTFAIIGSEKAEAIVGRKEPSWLGWRPNRAKSGIEAEHFPAPCVRFHHDGNKARLATVLYPSDNGETAVKAITLSADPADTRFTLTLKNGTTLSFDEKDYPVNP